MDDPNHEHDKTAAAQFDPFDPSLARPVFTFHGATLPKSTLSDDEAAKVIARKAKREVPDGIEAVISAWFAILSGEDLSYGDCIQNGSGLDSLCLASRDKFGQDRT